MSDVVIAFRGVSFSWAAGRPVLHRLDLDVVRGETLALVGRSGAGKSTVLKLINRVVLPETGEVTVEGRPTREWNPYALRRRAGYVLQDVGLFPHMRVEENITLLPRLAGWDAAAAAARAAELLELVGLPPDSFARRWPHELSGGQRQRVGVARALALDPPILLMDEPFGALDPITRGEMHDEFWRIQTQVRKTVVLVTHDIGEAVALGTRLGVLEAGRLVACDTPAALQRARDPRVMKFLERRVRSEPRDV